MENFSTWPVVLFLLSGTLCLGIGLFTWIRRRASRAVRPFTFMLFSVALWAALNALEMAQGNLDSRLPWLYAQFVVSSFIPPTFLAFTLNYTGRWMSIHNRNWFLFALEPALIAAVILMGWAEQSLIIAPRLVEHQGLSLLLYDRGPIWWLHYLYSTTFFLTGGILLLLSLFQTPQQYHGQVVALVVGTLVPWIAQLSQFVFAASPLVPSLSIFAFTITGLAFTWAVFRRGLLDLMPMVRGLVLEHMEDGVIVLDLHGRIADINPAAHVMFNLPMNRAIGLDAQKILPVDLAQNLTDATWTEIELNQRQYELRYTPLYWSPDSRAGTLLILHDVNDRHNLDMLFQQERELFLGGPVVVWRQIGNAAAGQMYVSANISQFGYSADEFISGKREYFSLIPPSDRERIRKNAQELILSGANFYEQDYPILTAEGEQRWVHDYTHVVRTADGRVLLYDWYMMDVTAQKQAEEAAQHARRVAEALRSAGEVLNATLNFEQVLDHILDQVSTVMEYHIGNVFLSLDGHAYPVRTRFHCEIPPAVRADVETKGYEISKTDNFRTMLESGQPLIIPDINTFPGWVHTEGSRLFNSWAGCPILSRGQLLAIFSLANTQPNAYSQKDAEALAVFSNQAGLALENARLYEAAQQRAAEAETLRKAGEGVAALELEAAIQQILDQLTHVVPYDTASVQLLKDDYTEIVGQRGFTNPEDVLGLRFPVLGDNPMQQVFKTRRPSIFNQIKHVYPEIFHQSPHNHIESWLGVPLMIQDKMIGALTLDSTNPAGYTPDHARLAQAFANQVAIALEKARLYTEMEAARDQAEEADRAKTSFLAMMSHELRTPMNGILGMVEVLYHTPLDVVQQEYLQYIRLSSESLLAILNDVLDFSRINAGHMQLEYRDFQPRAVIQDALGLATLNAYDKGLELIGDLDPSLPEVVCGDETRLKQVLLNLISNAVKFTDQGEVCVRAWAEMQPDGAPTLHFSVRDTGIGLPADRIPNLFEPFVQADSSTSRRYGGTGLGLSICRGICERMGGRIWVDQTAPVGSTFRFYVQVHPAASQELSAPPPQDLVGRVIAGVVPNASQRTALARELGGLGLRVSLVESIPQLHQEVLDPVNFQPDFLLMDAALSQGFTKILPPNWNAPAPALLWLAPLGWDARKTGALGGVLMQKPLRRTQMIAALRQARQGPPSAAAPAPAEAPAPPPTHPLRILLVEDHTINQKIALLLLQQLGHRADAVGNGQEALQALNLRSAAGLPYHLVLLDIEMPVMDGWETAQRIRADLPPAHQPILSAMTAHTLSGERERSLAVGMDAYLAKPIRMEELTAVLENAQRRAEQMDAVPSDSARLVDPAALQSWINTLGAGSVSRLGDIVNLFLEDTPRQTEAIRQAAEAEDWKTARRLTHTLKSSCRNLGAPAAAESLAQMEALASQLEHLEPQADAAAFHQRLQQLQASLPDLLTQMANLRDQLGLNPGASE